MFAAHRLWVRLCPRLWELVPVWSLIVKSYNFDASGYTQDETDGRQVISFCINSYSSHRLSTQPFLTVADLPTLGKALVTPTIAIVLGSQDPWTGSLSKWSPHSIAVLIQQTDSSLPLWIHIRRDRVSLIFYCPLLKVSTHRVSLHGSISVSEQTNLALISLLYPFFDSCAQARAFQIHLPTAKTINRHGSPKQEKDLESLDEHCVGIVTTADQRLTSFSI